MPCASLPSTAMLVRPVDVRYARRGAGEQCVTDDDALVLQARDDGW